MTIAEEVIRGSRPNRSPIELVVTVAAADLRARTSAASDGRGESDPIAAACYADGTAVSLAVARRLACDAGLVGIVERDDGAPLSVGRKTRAIPGAMKRALLKRDRCCRYPGCTNRIFVEGHHLRHWADGGETKLGNLVTLCRHHHRFVHEYGYTVELSGTEVRFVDPDGNVIRAVHEAKRPARLGWETIRARNTELAIDADTPACGWDGGRIDLVACIDDLVRADDRAARRIGAMSK